MIRLYFKVYGVDYIITNYYILHLPTYQFIQVTIICLQIRI